ncbi:MAG TPA: NAD-dependent epimerase/dehydratase family protein [Vicinamibacteria bacterium]|nr:NAD-dependent epimerase/dehydratase family protein [Vicinamibacteria bacterium]
MLFLTGASGYIGLRVGERLAAAGRRVRALVLPGDPVDPSARFPCEVVRGDVSRLDSFADQGAGVTEIVHAAAVMPPGTPEQMREVNVRGTANMLEAARRWGVRRFVYFSAVSAVYSEKNAYGASKAEAERMIVESGLDYTILRLTMVYGPDGGLHFRKLVSLLHRLPFVCPVPGPGTARLQPVYIGDVVRAVELSLGSATALGKAYNVSGGTVVAFRELIDRIAAAEGLRRQRVHVPLALCRAAASVLSAVLPPSFFSPDALLGLTQDADLDHSQFGTECGYAPVSLEEGFARVFGGGAAVR